MYENNGLLYVWHTHTTHTQGMIVYYEGSMYLCMYAYTHSLSLSLSFRLSLSCIISSHTEREERKVMLCTTSPEGDIELFNIEDMREEGERGEGF